MADIDPQQFGELKAQVATLIERDREMAASLQAMAASLQAMQLQMAEARGGWKLMVALGGAAASLGGFISWALTTFTGRG